MRWDSQESEDGQYERRTGVSHMHEALIRGCSVRALQSAMSNNIPWGLGTD